MAKAEDQVKSQKQTGGAGSPHTPILQTQSVKGGYVVRGANKGCIADETGEGLRDFARQIDKVVGRRNVGGAWDLLGKPRKPQDTRFAMGLR